MFTTLTNPDGMYNAANWIDYQAKAANQTNYARQAGTEYQESRPDFYRQRLRLGADVDPSKVSFRYRDTGDKNILYETFMDGKPLNSWNEKDQSFLQDV